MFAAAAAGIWLFYVQHQYEETYCAYRERGDWALSSPAPGTRRAASFHVHAEAGCSGPPRTSACTTSTTSRAWIPNYQLQKAYDNHAELRQVTRLSLWQSITTLRLTLWDEDAKQLVGFRELRGIRARISAQLEAGSAILATKPEAVPVVAASMSRGLRAAPLGALLLLAARPAAAQELRYDVGFPNAVHHEAQVTVTWRDLGPAPLRVQMSRSSPGRYAIHEFAKNVYALSAKDGRGRALAVTRTDPYGWTVSGHDGTVTVTYTLFGDHGDGTYAQIDATHAHLNMPATFLWAVGQEKRPIRVRFIPFDPNWKVATQLQPTADRTVFAAPDFQYFMDSPTELSDFDMREWQVGDGPTRATIRLAVHHDGTPADLDRFAASAKKVVAQHIAMWGEHPAYDFGTYTFIADYMPQISGDGMEHRNSTIISQPRSFKAANFAQIGTLSHEFFHSWNVERIRRRARTVRFHARQPDPVAVAR